MSDNLNVRWMLSFWHPDGDSRNEPDFPKVEFWHSDKESCYAAAARVLIELREERADQRQWMAAGRPEPLQVGAGRHPGGRWFLRYEDLEPDGGTSELSFSERLGKMRSAAGGWKDGRSAEELKSEIYEARRSGSRGDLRP